MNPRLPIFAGLAVLLAVTRFDHFGPLPDASLAVFVFGGLWLGGLRAFTLLFALAFATDLAAVSVESWRAYCMTPAYWGLVLTYAGLWVTGRWLAQRSEPLALPRLAWVLPLAFSAAFVASNAFWWAFSARFELPLADFWLSVARYYPPYLGAGLLQAALFWLAARTVGLIAGSARA